MIINEHWWWRPGWRPGRRMYTFHITFAHHPEVAELAARAQSRLDGLPGLDLIPARWLHLTTQGIGFTDEVPAEALAAIEAAARTRLAALQPATITLGPARSASEGITFWATPEHALDDIRAATRDAIAHVWSPDRVPDSEDWAPHVSIAYASTTGPSGAYDQALDGDNSTVTVTPSAVQLIALSRDTHLYQWTTTAELPVEERGREHSDPSGKRHRLGQLPGP